MADARRWVGPTVTGWEEVSHVGKKHPEGALYAPVDRTSTGETGSGLFLVDEMTESSARRWASNPVTLAGGCGVTTDSIGSVGSACSIDTVDARRRCARAHKIKGEPADGPDNFTNGSRPDGM